MSRSSRIRKLAQELSVSEDEILLWLMEHAPELGELHPASFVSAEITKRIRRSLGAPRPEKPPPQPIERRCAECLVTRAKEGVRVEATRQGEACQRCGDSVNKRAALALLDAFAERGLHRLLVVGGGPGTAEELRSLLGDAIELRIVDGEAHRDGNQAASELSWADIVAIWGGTILSHKVSKLYTDRRGEYREKLVTVQRRGAAALCQGVIEKLAAGKVGRRGG